MKLFKKKQRKEFWKKFIAYVILALMILSVATMAISVLAS